MHLNLSFLTILLVFSTTTIASQSDIKARNSYDPTNDLIKSYCDDSIGVHTGRALQQASDLRDIVGSLKDDPACKDVYQLSTSLINNIGALDSFYQTDDTELKQLQLEVNELSGQMEIERARLYDEFINNWNLANPTGTQTELDAAIAGFTPTSTLYTSMEAAYAQGRVDLITQQVAAEDPATLQSNERDYRFQQIMAINQTVNSLFSSLNDSVQCRSNHNFAHVLAQIGSQILASSTSVYGSIAGAVVLGISGITAGTTELIRHIRFNARMNRLENSRLQVAMGCSLEGIAKTYCAARDTRTVLNQAVRMREGDNCADCGNLFNGIELLTKKLPSFNVWVQRITAGSSPSNSAQAQERIRTFQLRNKLFDTIQRMAGSINQTKVALTQISGGGDVEDQRHKLVLGLMQTLRWTIQGNVISQQGEGPYANAFVEDTECGPRVYMYSLGAARVAKGREGREDCDQYVRRKYPNVFEKAPSVETIEGFIAELNQEATTWVNLRVRQVHEQNPRLVLALYESENSRYLSTPKGYLHEAMAYLLKFKEELDEDENQYHIELIDHTHKLMKEAVDLVEKPCEEQTTGTFNCDGDADYPTQQITELGTLLSPNQQTLTIANSFHQIVKQDVDMKLAAGDISDEQLRFLMRLSPENSSEFLIRKYFDIQQAYDDVANAMYTTESNLSIFGDMFKQKYFKGLRKLYRELKRNPNDTNRKRLLGEYCVKALIIPPGSSFHRNNKRRLKKFCSGAVYPSSFPREVADLTFDEMSKRSYSEKICRVYDFKRKLKLFEIE